MYFGGQTPTNYVVKVPTRDKLFYVYWYPYVYINDLSFEGSNKESIYYQVADYGKINNCSINFSGSHAIYFESSYGEIEGNIINHINGQGIWTIFSHNNIINNTIANIGMIEGMALIGSYTNGISVGGDDSLAQYNVIDSTGYHGIAFGGKRDIIKNNTITNYLLNLNDGGGIYTGESGAGSVIDGNIIINGIGKLGKASYGLGVMGIYLDAYSSYMIVRNNIVANCPSKAINLQVAHNISLQNNTLYSCQSALNIAEWSNGNTVYNITMNNNILFNADVLNNSAFEFGSNYGTLGTFGPSDYNYFMRYTNDVASIYTYEQAVGGNIWVPRSLSNWQIYTGQDLNSTELIIPSPSDILFDYNATQSNKIVSLGTNTYVDVTGATYTGSVTLLPYTSIILIKTN